MCVCVRANDGRVNSIPPFHSVFLYIFQRFERNSIEQIRTVRVFPRFQGTRNKRNKRRFDSLRVRVYAFRMRPLLAFRFAFVPGSKGTSFPVPLHPSPRRDIDIDRSVVT